MLRILLFYLIPFLLPFVGYFTYRYLVTDGRALLENTPWFLLSVSGLGLVVASLLTLAFVGGWDAGGEYAPPRLEDGRIVPGEVRRPGDVSGELHPLPEAGPTPLPADVH